MLAYLYIVLALLVILFFKISQNALYNKITTYIDRIIKPHFVKIEPSTEQFADMATALWQIENKLNKIINENSLEAKARAIISNLNKIKSVLKAQDVEVIDLTNQKYNEGLNVNVLSVEKNPNLKEPYIKETIEPVVTHKGIIVQKAKVIVETNEE